VGRRPRAGQGGHAYAIQSPAVTGGKSSPSRLPPHLPQPAFSRQRYRGGADGIWAER